LNRSDSLKKGKNYVEMILLCLLSEKECYGYQLSQLVKEYSEGIISMPEGSLYPALYRLMADGYIVDEKRLVGKRLQRVYYHIQPSGIEYLRILIDEYNTLNQGIYNILYNSKKEEKIYDENNEMLH